VVPIQRGQMESLAVPVVAVDMILMGAVVQSDKVMMDVTELVARIAVAAVAVLARPVICLTAATDYSTIFLALRPIMQVVAVAVLKAATVTADLAAAVTGIPAALVMTVRTDLAVVAGLPGHKAAAMVVPAL
jgi:hypothetical protein